MNSDVTMGSVHGPHTIKSVLNFQNAQKCAFLIMICFSLYHGVLMITKPDGNLCKSLLSDGSAGPAGEWRPYGCMTHIYSTKDSNRCMKHLAAWGDSARLYFVGDSRLLTLFHAFGKHLNKSYVLPDKQRQPNRTAHLLMLKNDHSVMCFFGHDEITASMVSLVETWSKIQKGILPKSPERSSNITQSEKPGRGSPTAVAATTCTSIPPTHLVLSLGTKTIERFNHSETGLLDYQKSLEELAIALSSIKFTRTVWMLQDPVAEGLLSADRKLITNKEIDAYNAIAQHIMQKVPGVEIWRSNRLIAQRMGFPAVNWRCPTKQMASTLSGLLRINALLKKNDTSSTRNKDLPPAHCVDPPPLSDGFHVSDEAMARNVQVLLNLYCNNHMKFEDGTCCRSPEPITSVQMRCFVFIGLCLVTTLFCFIYDTVLRSRTNLCVRIKRMFARGRYFWRRGTKPILESVHSTEAAQDPFATSTTFDEFYELTRALSKFGLILVYFFICDRTILFMKTNKGFTIMSFLLPLAYFLILGLFFSGPTKETRLNHVDITREWKGWMQVYFLIYHFTGSYRVVPLFSFTRYLTSAYLFLSGFGHFYYFWHRPLPGSILCKLLPIHFSLGELYATCQAWWQVFHRYLYVMFRMNFFVLGLCLVMNRDYLFYYFMPLVSFWFTVVFILIIAFPQVTSPVAASSVPSPLPLPVTTSNTETNGQTIPATEADKKHSLTADESSLVESHSLLPSMCPNLFTASVPATSTRCVGAKSSLSTPRQMHCYDSPASIAGCELVRHSRVPSSSMWTTADVRGHHKARSVGALSDVRQLTEPTLFARHVRSARSKLQATGCRSGPPWPEDWFQKLRSMRVSNSCDRARMRTATTAAKSFSYARARRCLCCHLRLADILIVLKLGCLVAAIEVLNRSTEWFRALFFSGPQRRLFELTSAAPNPMEPYDDETMREEQDFWYRRWSLDRYSVVYGMLFALVCEWARRVGWLTDASTCDLGLVAATPVSDRTNLFACRGAGIGGGGSGRGRAVEPGEPKDLESNRFSPNPTTALATPPAYPPDFPTAPFRRLGQRYSVFSRITCRRCTALGLTTLGVLGIGVSMLLAFRCDDKVFCAQAHAFLCLIPILSYILVRNSLGVLRRTHSILFAWFGDISLELFIAQHHIWLSADGNGILVLLPGYPLLNLALTSFVFVCVCHEMHQLTLRLQRFIVPSSAVQAVRNLLLIGVVLHGITHSSWRLSAS